MPPSNDRQGRDDTTGFRSDAEMLAVVARQAEGRIADRRRKQRFVAAGVAVIVTAVLGASVFAATRPDGTSGRNEQLATAGSSPVDARGTEADEANPVTSTTLTRDPLPDDARPEGWLPMAESPLSPRANAVSAWTGSELLVWGGEGETTDTCSIQDDGSFLCGEQARSDGAAYDPGTDSWRAMAVSPLPPENGSEFHYRGVWTGTELLVWGGPEGLGAAYDPAEDSWRSISAGTFGPRRRFDAVWTGSHMVVVGGGRPPQTMGPFGPTAAVGRYDPESDSWAPLPQLPSDVSHPIVVLADERLVVFDQFSAVVLVLDDGRWSEIAGSPVGQVDDAVWTGERLVVSGAETDDQTGPAVAALLPLTGTWEVLPDPVGSVRAGHLGWTGTEVVLLPQTPLGEPVRPLVPVAIDLRRADTWRTVDAADLDAVQGAVVAWTGAELLYWGGAIQGGYGADPRDAGARYSPGPGR